MSDSPKARRPAGLGARGRRLWDAVTGEYDLRTDEKELLLELCREYDLIEALEDVRRTVDLVDVGSTGQSRMHPVVGELRQRRLVVARLSSELALPDEDDEGNSSAMSRRGRKAALQRWRPRRAEASGGAS